MSDSVLAGHRVACRNAVVIDKDGQRRIITDVERVTLLDQQHGEQDFETGLWHPRWLARFDTVQRVDDATADLDFQRRELGRFVLRQERKLAKYPLAWPIWPRV